MTPKDWADIAARIQKLIAENETLRARCQELEEALAISRRAEGPQGEPPLHTKPNGITLRCPVMSSGIHVLYCKDGELGCTACGQRTKGGSPLKPISKGISSRCHHPARNGEHELYFINGRLVCKACGEEE